MPFADPPQTPVQPTRADRGSDIGTARLALEEAWRELAPIVDAARSLEARASQNPSLLSDPWVAAHTRWLQLFDREIKAVEAVYDAASAGSRLSLDGIRAARDAAQKLLRFITTARERVSPSGEGIVKALLELQDSANETRRNRGEVELDLMGPYHQVDVATRGSVEQLAATLNLDAAAVAATLGVRLREARRSAEAQPLLEAAADEGDAIAANTLGLIFEEQRKPDEARRRFRESAEKGDHQGRYNLGRVLWQDGEHAEAERWLQASEDPLAAEFLSRAKANRPGHA